MNILMLPLGSDGASQHHCPYVDTNNQMPLMPMGLDMLYDFKTCRKGTVVLIDESAVLGIVHCMSVTPHVSIATLSPVPQSSCQYKLKFSSLLLHIFSYYLKCHGAQDLRIVLGREVVRASACGVHIVDWVIAISILQICG